MLGHERLVAPEELLDLHRVVSERLGRGVDRRETAADHHDRHAQLQIGHRVDLRGPGELQCHQEVGGHAHAAGEAVGQVQHRGPSRAGGEGNMIETERECVVDRERAAEARAAEKRELPAPLDQQADHLEEVLVPAHGDAVFGHAAEACHQALVQALVEILHVAHRMEGHAFTARRDAGKAWRQRLDLEPVDRHHRVTVVHEMVCEREAGRTHADDEHLAAGGSAREGAREVERVPAREQAVDLEAPRQFQHVL